MERNDLESLKMKISSLDVNEQKLRDLYLRDIALGKIAGPMTGYASIDKPWLKYYGAQEINSDIPRLKAYDYVVLNNKNNLDSVAIEFLGTKLTYRQLFKKVDEVTKSLYSLGVRNGDIVTLAMANTPETIYLFYGLNRLGAICNFIDPRYSEDEFKRELNAVNSKYLFSLDMCSDIISKVLPETNIEKIIYLSPIETMPFFIRKMYELKKQSSIDYNDSVITWKDFISLSKSINEDNIDSPYKNDEPLALVHTGGTTGVPKGVLLTNESFVSMANMHLTGNLEFKKGDKFLNFLPPFIAYCISNGINMPLTVGVSISLVPTFKPEDFPNLLKKYKPNHVLSGPILWEFLMKSDINDLSYLISPVSGGDSLTSEMEIKINQYLISKGCKYKLAQGYGMSEVTSAATYSPERANKTGSVGIPFIKNIISVFDPETLEEKEYGEDGEIWISTPTMMKEYYNNVSETNNVIVIDKYGRTWIRTSDIGKITQDGNIIIIGRVKRMIVRNGNKIFPSQC